MYNKSEIYMVINNVTGKRYIGQVMCYYRCKGKYTPAGIEKRWYNHVYYAKNNIKGRGSTYLIHSIQKYGENNHSRKVIYTCDISKANYYETKYIRQYNTMVPNGMNIMKGGKNSPLSEVTKQKLRIQAQGKYVGEKNPRYGAIVTEETRQRIRESQLGKKWSEETHKKIREGWGKRQKFPKQNLPKHIMSIQDKGYIVKHPNYPHKQFTSQKLTLINKLELAKKYLQECLEEGSTTKR